MLFTPALPPAVLVKSSTIFTSNEVDSPLAVAENGGEVSVGLKHTSLFVLVGLNVTLVTVLLT